MATGLDWQRVPAVAAEYYLVVRPGEVEDGYVRRGERRHIALKGSVQEAVVRLLQEMTGTPGYGNPGVAPGGRDAFLRSVGELR